MESKPKGDGVSTGECEGCGLPGVAPGRACARCGVKSNVAVLPTQLVDGRYALEYEIGRGGMGVVYLARDTGLRRPVALKLIAPALVRDPIVAERLRDEARVLASVQSRHIVQVYALGRHEDSYFFAMEYVRGRSLQRILAEHRTHRAVVPTHRALTILERIAEGIDAAHQAGIIHRDVKPANIVIEEDTGRPVLVDFGLAVQGARLGAAPVAGTPDYTAPEQTGLVAGLSIGPWTDVYSLGCTAFEIFAGRIPFDDPVPDAVLLKHATVTAPLVSSLRREHAPFDAVIARAMAKAPGDRYPTPSAFVTALLRANEQTERRAAQPATLPPAPVEDDDTIRVLVVDDDPDFRRFATRAVQLAFYRQNVRVTAAASGAAALAIAEQRAPDLLILDFDMPGLDGADTLSRLRALPNGAGVRVAVVSGRVGLADRWRFSLLGVRDFVAKPTDLQALVMTISDIAERSGWREKPRDDS